MSEQEKKHNGNLDEGGTVSVFYHDPIYSIFGPGSGVCIGESFGPDKLGMTPAQALSLLAWLRQEEAELQRLAKEQEGG